MRAIRSAAGAQRVSQPAANAKAPTKAPVHPMKAMVPAMAAAAILLSAVPDVRAVGLESIELPPLPSDLTELGKMSDVQAKKLAEADATFQQSDTLKRLLEQSEAKRAENKKEIQNKYCYRQAELGIGDCGGLRLIPGMTDSGKQKTPKWLADLLGVEMPPEEEQNQLTLKDLFKGKTYE